MNPASRVMKIRFIFCNPFKGVSVRSPLLQQGENGDCQSNAYASTLAFGRVGEEQPDPAKRRTKGEPAAPPSDEAVCCNLGQCRRIGITPLMKTTERAFFAANASDLFRNDSREGRCLEILAIFIEFYFTITLVNRRLLTQYRTSVRQFIP